jgi:hypothetical protein
LDDAQRLLADLDPASYPEAGQYKLTASHDLISRTVARLSLHACEELRAQIDSEPVDRPLLAHAVDTLVTTTTLFDRFVQESAGDDDGSTETDDGADAGTGRDGAGAQQRLPGAAVAIGLVVLLVDATDHAEQPFVLDDATSPLAGRALVVSGRRHAQDPADRLDAKAAAMPIDIAAHFVRSASSSFAKNTLADFKISLARRSSKFSLHSRRSSARSPLLGRSGRAPLSASARRTLLRNVSGCMPRSAAICAIGRSLSNANRTPRCTSSARYFLGPPMTQQNPFLPGQHPRNQDTAKARLAQVSGT